MVSATGVLEDKSTLEIKPSGPTGAAILSAGCTGVTNQGTAPLNYSTTVVQDAVAGTCKWTLSTITPGTAAVGNILIGTEKLHIPSDIAVGTSVTQTAKPCGPPDPLTHTALCSPTFLPMGTSGAGSCVGAAAIPVLGGCAPSLPSSSSPTPSQSGNGNGPGTGTTGQTESSSAAAVATTTTKTPFTSGPEHPLPVVAVLVAAGGLGLAGLALVAPPFLRRRRRDI